MKPNLNRADLRFTKKLIYKKALQLFILCLLSSSQLSAQTNTSYDSDNIPLSGTGNYNCVFGKSSSSGYGDRNIAVGYGVLSNITGADNVGIGYNALNVGNSGNFNIGVGTEALRSINNGISNIGIGYWAQYSNASQNFNTAIGDSALTLNSGGNYNTAMGNSALYAVQGDYNTGFGSLALYHGGGSGNTATGYLTLYAGSGNYNTVNGYASMYGASGAGGSHNTASGAYSLFNYGGGSMNTAIGDSALFNLSTASYNTAVGRQALFISDGDRNTALGNLADVGNSTFTRATAIGDNAVVNASNRIYLGTGTDQLWCPLAIWSGSDKRFKTDIKAEDVKGLEFIKLLRPVAYNFDTKKLTEHMTANMPESRRKDYLNRDFSESTAIRQSGFIAQEVEEAAKKCGYNFSGVHVADPNNNTDTYGLSYSQFVVPLVKGMQEQQAMIEKLQQEVAELKKANGTTGLSQAEAAAGFAMEQNIPNPFTHETVVKYNLPQQAANAYMAVYDLNGKQVITFPITEKGASSLTITSDKLSAGIYIYSIVADGKIMDSKRMVVAEK